MFKLKQVANDLKQSSKYIGIATVIFIACIFIGFTNDQLTTFLTAQIQSLSVIAESLENSSNPTLMFIFLFSLITL